ncbi:hypothetical protein [Nonomuraea fuscirosea]|uniref:hypothetical protein n=1 Tax=Nonomuraea fuscirosea TaxID=1291556 RepID=UPI0033C4E76B
MSTRLSLRPRSGSRHGGSWQAMLHERTGLQGQADVTKPGRVVVGEQRLSAGQNQAQQVVAVIEAHGIGSEMHGGDDSAIVHFDWAEVGRT